MATKSRLIPFRVYYRGNEFLLYLIGYKNSKAGDTRNPVAHRMRFGFAPVSIRGATQLPACISRTRRRLLRQLGMRWAGQMDGFFQ